MGGFDARAYICLGAILDICLGAIRLPNIWLVSPNHSGYPCLHNIITNIITKIYEIDQNSKYWDKNAQPYFPHLLIGKIYLQNGENQQKYFWRQRELIAASIPTVNLSS